MGLSGDHKGKEGCGAYTNSHPNITHMTPQKGKMLRSPEEGSGTGSTSIDVTHMGGLSTKLPKRGK